MSLTSLSALLAGAVEESGVGVAAHYGQPIAEARALAEGRAVVDFSHGGVISVAGPDRLNWLNSITSQRLDGLLPGQSVETFVLSPNGRIEFVAAAVDDGQKMWLLVAPEALLGLLAFLQKMKFMMRVEIADETQNFAQLLTFNADLAAWLQAELNAEVVWQDPWAQTLPGGHQYATASAYDWGAIRLLVPRGRLAEVPAMVRAGRFSMAGLRALEALEIRAWRPSAADLDELALPHEFDWLRTAVHLNKGCYRGQETVAKVHNLGHPPRRLVMLHFVEADGELPQPGALVRAEADPSKPVGRVTRAALHHDWGAIALALVKRRTAPDARLVVDMQTGPGLVAEQEIIVPVEAGATKSVPRLPRLG